MPIPLPRLFELDLAMLPMRPFPRVLEAPTALKSWLKSRGDAWPKHVAAVSLRWRMVPDLGFPPNAFSVWRRLRFLPPLAPIGAPLQIVTPGQVSFTWSAGPLMDIGFQCNSTAGLNVSARDERGDELPGQRIVVPPGLQNIRFHCPNICRIQLTGIGTITNILGVTLLEFVNPAAGASAWQPVLESPHIPILFHPTDTAAANTLAQQRLLLANLVFSPPAAVAGLTWPSMINGAGLLSELADPDGLLPQLNDMMAQPPDKRATHKSTSSDTSDSTVTAEIPIQPITLMAASMDTWLAVAIGLGSTEFEDAGAVPDGVLMPPSPANPFYDYMVSAEFDAPGIQPNKLVVCAVANPPSFPPAALGTLTADSDLKLRRRPEVVNQPYLDEVRLRWARQQDSAPYGYHVAIQSASGQKFLNELRAGAPAPFLPTYRTEALADDLEFHTHRDRACPAPLKKANSPSTFTYYVSQTDCFGRSTPWVSAAFNSVVAKPQVPSLVAVRQSGPAQLEVEWTWNHTDRTWGQPSGSGQLPGEIEFRLAVFAPSKPAPDPETLPTIPSVLVTHVEIPIADSPPGVTQYRSIISNVAPSFTPAESGWINLFIFAKAKSWVDSGTWSDFSSPAIAHLADPTPPAAPKVKPDIHWTAAPDAENVARAILPFPSVPGAVGYAVYRASESAIRLAVPAVVAPDLNTGAIDSPPGGPSWNERRDALLTAFQVDPNLRDIFLRVNSTLSETSRIEAEVSGDATDLWAYCVKAVSATNIESQPSDAAFVAVPQELKPTSPHILTREAASHVEVKVFADTHAASAALFVTRNRALVDDAGKLGPPLLELSAATACPDPLGATDPMQVKLERCFESPLDLARSWRPYYLCAQAYSNPAADSGYRPSRSTLSNVAKLYLVPSGLPDLAAAGTRWAPPGGGVVQVRSAAELPLSPLGFHRLEFFILRSPLDVSVPSRDEWILHESKSKNGLISRSTKRNATGQWTYALTVGARTSFVLTRLTDPGGRIAEVLQDVRLTAIERPADGDLLRGGFNQL